MSAGRTARATNWFCYTAFALSGFAGLMYESVWARYLRTFLGAEAHAQALTLALFMGGLALGAWVVARCSARIARPLLAYAGLELLLALLAMVFHFLFETLTGWSFTAVLPALSDYPGAMAVCKWGLAALLIFPQCVLLGGTFPLLAAGMTRARPGAAGHALACLYFTNSAGGAIGVLVNGFLIIPVLGLPGALVTAGLLNGAAALLVWLAARVIGQESTRVLPPSPAAAASGRQRLCLLAAAVTGAASLVYQLVWVRLLNMVLGASTHSFELMLSAFIGGLALGGLWIRRHADRIDNPLFVLGIIQLVMGGLAIATLLLYRQAFDGMYWLLQALQRTEPGYLLFNLGSHALALLVMLPATICAGMTLPLLTRHQLVYGAGEPAIGRIYAANTLGAILAVFLTAHLLLPGLGVKGALLTGAALDLALGSGLLALTTARMRWRPVGALLTVGILLTTILLPGMDRFILSSGVFMGNRPTTPTATEEREMDFYRDGKTATIAVLRDRAEDGVERLAFTTNGKGNGALFMNTPPERVSHDEPSFGMLGALPLLLQPDLERAACIGIGTGFSAHALLGSPRLEHLDIIELEPATIAAARRFAARTGDVFSDSRVRFHAADARTFFHSHTGPKYDLIMSNPSNLWVSGVSALYTEQFYAALRNSLSADGLLVQWLQLYNADEQMVFSVLHALGRHFTDYALYQATSSDLMIVAVRRGRAPQPQPQAFAWPTLTTTLTRIGVVHEADLALRWVGNREQIEPLVEVIQAPPNSDYYPLVEQRAVRARFLGQSYQAFSYWRDAYGYPLLNELAERDLGARAGLTQRRFFAPSIQAARLRQALLPRAEQQWRDLTLPNLTLPISEWLARLQRQPCDQMLAQTFAGRALPELVRLGGAWLPQASLERLYAELDASACAAALRAGAPQAWDFIRAALLRDYETTARLGGILLEQAPPDGAPYVRVATAAARLRLGQYEQVLTMLEALPETTPQPLAQAMTLLAAHAAARKNPLFSVAVGDSP